MVGLAVLGLVAAVALTDIGGSKDRATTPTTPTAPTTTLVPPDIETPRATVNLNDVPGVGADPSEVARWWAATYTAHVGADAPEALATRLKPATDQSLLAELRTTPPAASYDEAPVAIEGVSQSDPVDGGAGETLVRVSVETPGALVVYDLTLVEADRRWLVSKAVRV